MANDSVNFGRLPLRVFLASGALLLVSLAFAATALRSPWLYLAFHAVCHQRPDRCLLLLGVPMPLCARCIAIYCGASLGLLLPLPASRRIFLAAVVLIVADAATEAIGLRPAWPGLRMATGAFAGFTAAPLVLDAVWRAAVGIGTAPGHDVTTRMSAR